MKPRFFDDFGPAPGLLATSRHLSYGDSGSERTSRSNRFRAHLDCPLGSGAWSYLPCEAARRLDTALGFVETDEREDHLV